MQFFPRGVRSGSGPANPLPNDRATAGAADGETVPLRPSSNPNGRGFVVSHGNSFSAAANREFWSLLLLVADILAEDFRHPGRNPCGNFGRHPMPVMVRDGLGVVPAAALDGSGRTA